MIFRYPWVCEVKYVDDTQWEVEMPPLTEEMIEAADEETHVYLEFRHTNRHVRSLISWQHNQNWYKYRTDLTPIVQDWGPHRWGDLIKIDIDLIAILRNIWIQMKSFSMYKF